VITFVSIAMVMTATKLLANCSVAGCTLRTAQLGISLCVTSEYTAAPRRSHSDSPLCIRSKYVVCYQLHGIVRLQSACVGL